MKKLFRYPLAVTIATSFGIALLLAVAFLPWPDRPAVLGGEAFSDRSTQFGVDLVECSTLMDPLEEEITQLLEVGRECTSDDQCQVRGFGCPFGCRSVVNRNAVSEILAAVDRYSRLGETCGMCVYRCLPLPPGQAVCETNRCTYRADEPPSLRELIETIQ